MDGRGPRHDTRMNEADDAPELSVVIPIYNEEEILRSSVEELIGDLDTAGITHEIWLAENGSRDQTIEIATELREEHPQVDFFSYPEPNYGGALREGIFRARGRFVVCEEIDLCDVNFLDGEPFKPVDSAWNRAFEGLPGGEYTITVEASDYYGNIADRVEITITLEGGPVDPTGGDTDTAGDGSGGESDSSDPSDTNDTFVSEGDDSSGGDTDGSGGGASDDGGSSSGCSVGTEGGAGGSIALMLGLFGLGFVRRRR